MNRNVYVATSALALVGATAVLSAVALTACEKEQGGAPVSTAPASTAAANASSAVAAASAAVASAASAIGSTGASAASAVVASASAATTAAASAAGSSLAAAKGSSTAKTDAKPVGMHLSGSNFAVDVSAPGDCKANAPCAMTIKLAALGAYHINNEYPYKWVGDAVDGIEYTGKKTGDFHKDDATHATMSVAFKSAAQPAHVAGTYKLSVCSEDKCQIETQRVDLSVPMN